MSELFKETRNIEMCNTYHLYKLYFSIHFEERIVKTIVVVFKKFFSKLHIICMNQLSSNWKQSLKVFSPKIVGWRSILIHSFYCI